MICKITYIAFDGTEFLDAAKCKEYEENQLAEKEVFLEREAKNVGENLWYKYFPDRSTQNSEMKSGQELQWLEKEILEIILKSNAHPSLELIKRDILSLSEKSGTMLLEKLDFVEIQKQCQFNNH